MRTPTRSITSARLDRVDEIRRIVANAKASGALRGPKDAAIVQKNGTPAAAEGAIRTQWMDVTPDMAKQWLGNNFRNRKMLDDVVHAYARDMINGVWVPTHQGVAFNDKDELIDGQHRLQAIVLSGRTVRMMITFGLPSAIAGSEMTTMDAVDRGRTRSVADQLTIQHGFKNASITAQICNSLAALCYGERTRLRRLSVGQTLEIFRAFEHPIEWVILHRVKTIGLRQAGVLAAFAFALATEAQSVRAVSEVFDDRTEFARMYFALVSGEGLKQGSAIAALRAFLTSEEAKLLTRGTDRGVAELVLQAIWLEMHSEKVDKLTPALDGANYFRGIQAERVAKMAAMFEIRK